MTGWLWGLAAVAPLGLAFLLVFSPADDGRLGRTYAWGTRLAQLTLLPALVLTLLPPDPTGIVAAARASWLLLGTDVGLDPTGRALLLVAVVLYAAALTAVSWRHTRRPGQLKAFLLVSFVGNMGVYAAADAVTFYLSYAVMSFAAAGLVLHERTASARRAGRVYLVLTVISEAAVLGGVLLAAAAGGRQLAAAPLAVAESPHTGPIVALLVLGFGTKAALVPLHVWLPLAHPAAPPAASAVLSGAMVKAGLVGWFRFLPLGEAVLDGWGRTLVLLALLGALGAVLLGIGQRDAKVVLAYSTVSQMGYLSAVVGVALAQPALAPAAIASAAIYAVHHGLAKGALFLGVAVWKHHAKGRARALVIGGLVLAGLAVVGAPLTSGALGKYATKNAVEGAALLGLDLVHLLPLVATGSTVLLVRFVWLLVRSDTEPLPIGSDPELPAWLAIVVTSLVLPWAVAAAWLPVSAVPGLDPVTVWGATWPILVGLAASVAAWRAAGARRSRPGGPRWVPPGDLLVAEERVIVLVHRRARRLGQRLAGAREWMAERMVLRRGNQPRDWVGRRHDIADDLGSQPGTGVLVLALLAVLVLVQGVGQ